ncbi:hypothetical protein PVK06_034229 [Gossypium arboreum]|uniref:Uncharacterized protein n=1 Tax=Gossypium arboreum TaxID=29729 RepID=A0ABR0NDK6_GOSAR|nr:hypothetical protein PVK06_034229 [Gossypium arboreum]
MDIDSTANGSLSFKDMLMNENKNNEVLKDTDSNDINLKEEDVITKIIGGIPSVRFFDRVHGILSQSIKRTVIMKLLGCLLKAISNMAGQVIKIDENTFGYKMKKEVKLKQKQDKNGEIKL